MTTLEVRRVPFGTKILYGLGAAANGVKTRAMGTFLMLYYNQVVGLSPALVSGVLMIALICDAFFDPSVGQASDNFRSKWGRRHPFMYVSALPYAIGFFLLWNPPQGLSEIALLGWLLGSVLMIRLFDSFYELPSAALAPELASDYNERTTLISIRWFFGLASGIILALLAYRVFMRENADGTGGVLSRDGYFAFSVTGAAIIFTVILISSLGTHSQIKHLRQPPPRKITVSAMAREMFATLNNKNFLVLTITGMLAAIVLGIASGLNIYFGLYFWGFTQTQLATLVVAGVISGIIGVTCATPISAAFGKKRAALVMFTLAVAAMSAPPLLRVADMLPPNGTPFIFWLIFSEQIAFGAMGIMTSIIVTSMIADVVEESELRTGRRSEGLLFSADNFFKKLVSGVGIFVAGIILTVIEFPRGARPNQIDQSILDRMALFYVPTALALFGLAIICLCFYTIDRAQHEDNLRKLRAIATPAE